MKKRFNLDMHDYIQRPEGKLVFNKRLFGHISSAAFLDFSKSPNRFVQTIQDFLLRFRGGFRGIVLHRNPQLYTYIAASLRQFPDRSALKQLIAKLGFTNIRSSKHFFGFTETVIFQKT